MERLNKFKQPKQLLLKGLIFVCLLSFDIHDLHHVGFVGGVFILREDHNHFASALHEVVLLSDFNNHLDNIVTRLVGRDFRTPNTPHTLEILNHWVDDGAGENWNWGSVFWNETGDTAGIGHTNNEVDV